MAQSTTSTSTDAHFTYMPALWAASKRFIAGGAAAAIAETFTIPFDVVKVRLQLDRHNVHNRVGAVGTVRAIVASEGVRGLFKGLTPALIRQVTYTAITMSLYKPVRRTLMYGNQDQEDPGYLVKLLSGGIAGGIGIAVVNPVEVVKVGLQADRAGLFTPVSATKHIFHNFGLAGFSKGLLPNIQRGFIVNAAELGTYDHCKHLLIEHGWVSEGFWAHLASSFVAGFAGAAASNPIDVVKTRLMSQASSTDVVVADQYKGVTDCLARIVKEEGLGSLYKGFLPNWFRKGPWCMIFFVSYEQIFSRLQD